MACWLDPVPSELLMSLSAVREPAWKLISLRRPLWAFKAVTGALEGFLSFRMVKRLSFSLLFSCGLLWGGYSVWGEIEAKMALQRSDPGTSPIWVLVDCKAEP